MAHSGLRLVDDMHAAYLAGGVGESQERREERMYALIAQRQEEVTMTLMLMLSDMDPLHNVLNNALLGLRYSKDMQRPEFDAVPLFPWIELQSLRKSCPKCRAHKEKPKEAPKCERQGQYHNVTYKTGSKSGTAADHRMITGMGGTVENNVLCEVDPETGRFRLPPLEAKKALREWGENVIKAHRRHPEKDPSKGDRWKIREVRHFELYGNAALIGSNVSQDVHSMSVAD